jgi:hypothetical protein
MDVVSVSDTDARTRLIWGVSVLHREKHTEILEIECIIILGCGAVETSC